MEGFMLLVVIGTSLWVLIDAKSIGVRKGQIKGLGDMGPWGWFWGCLLLWIIGFPLYLVKRGEFKRVNAGASMPPLQSPPEPSSSGHAAPRYCSACGAPQRDPNGRFCVGCGRPLSM